MDGVKLEGVGVVVRCPNCGQSNRLRYEALGKSTRCGKCRTDLRPPGTPVDVPDGDVFRALIGRSALPVVVDFWAEWCGPCRMVAPELMKVAASHAGEFIVAKVDTEALPDVAGPAGIRSIPTMAVFHGGREIARTAGARPAAQIVSFVEQALAQHAR
jgi:thioredoxin 2